MLTELCKELKNWFETDKVFGVFTIENGSIDLSKFVQDGQYFRIIGSVFNDGVYEYPTTNLKDETFDGAIWPMAVPPAVIDLASEIGEWVGKYGDVVIPDGIPAIIERNLFERVRRRMDANKHAPARVKADEEYLLTTKLFCGNCGRLMAGESGKSSTNGIKYRYYKCSGAKRKLGCHKKPLRKGWIEQVAVLLTVQTVLTDANIARIAEAIVVMQEEEDTMTPALERQLQECEKGINNLLNAIQAGILTSSTKERMEKLEAQREELKRSILQARMERPKYTKEEIVQWISRYKYGNIDDADYQKEIIDTFLNSIYVYDDRLVFTYNYRDGTETLTLKNIEAAFGSDLKNLSPPQSPKYTVFRGFYCSCAIKCAIKIQHFISCAIKCVIYKWLNLCIKYTL